MIKRLATTGVLIAAVVVIGWLLFAVPGVEGISATSFFAGYFLGAGSGMMVGAAGMLLYAGPFNPLGPAPPPVLLAQVVGMGLVGGSGGLWRLAAARVRRPEITAAAFGAGLALGYDIITNYGVAVSMGRAGSPLPVIAAGLPFSVAHVVSNAMIFTGVAALIARRYGFRTKGGGA
jgi:hypothetical protein